MMCIRNILKNCVVNEETEKGLILMQENLIHFKANERPYKKHVQLFTYVSWCVCVWTLEGEVSPELHTCSPGSLYALSKFIFYTRNSDFFKKIYLFSVWCLQVHSCGRTQTGTPWWFTDDGPRRVCAAALCSLEGAVGVPSTSRTLWKVWNCIYLLCIIHDVIVY